MSLVRFQKIKKEEQRIINEPKNRIPFSPVSMSKLKIMDVAIKKNKKRIPKNKIVAILIANIK